MPEAVFIIVIVSIVFGTVTSIVKMGIAAAERGAERKMEIHRMNANPSGFRASAPAPVPMAEGDPQSIDRLMREMTRLEDRLVNLETILLERASRNRSESQVG